MLTEKATFGAGCFWGIEAAFMEVKGVIKTEVGYMGGTLKNPSYHEVCSDKTGHVEVVQVTFNPLEVSYQKLLEVFWNNHNPTQLNRQGPDVGSQYRSVIFYNNEEQKELAIKSLKDLEKSKKYKQKIVTEIIEVKTFYKAEEYHQQYLKKRGLRVCH